MKALFKRLRLLPIAFHYSAFVPHRFLATGGSAALVAERAPIAEVGNADMGDILRFVENGLIYRLPWAMEAVRVRAQANQDDIQGGRSMTLRSGMRARSGNGDA